MAAFKLRATEQRKAIFAVLQGNTTHPTAEDIYLTVKRDLPSISLATVYRNLKMLVAQGSITEIALADGPARYDFRTDDHQHFICDFCGRVYDLKVSLGQSLHELRKAGFALRAQQLLIYGLCPRCRSERTARPS